MQGPYLLLGASADEVVPLSLHGSWEQVPGLLANADSLHAFFGKPYTCSILTAQEQNICLLCKQQCSDHGAEKPTARTLQNWIPVDLALRSIYSTRTMSS